MKVLIRTLLASVVHFLAIYFFFISTAIAATQGPTIILFSDNSESYIGPAKAFQQKLQTEVLEYKLADDIEKAPMLMQDIMEKKPSLIFALGARAAWFAKAATKKQLDTKVVFAMVLNWERYDLLDGQPNITGISTEISPGTQLFNLGLLSSEVKKIGVIYSVEHSNKAIHIAKEAAKLLGFELVTVSIQHAGEFNRAWRQISGKMDAYWVFNDPVLYTMKNIHWLNERCLKEKILCVGQSDNITKLGILLSINTDNDNIGSQAASVAKKLMHKELLGNTIHSPIGTRITINTNTAKKIGLTLNENFLSMVNNVIEQ